MRRLVWLSLGLAAACATGIYLVSDGWLLWLSLFSFCGGIPLFFLKTNRSRITAVTLLGLAVGFFWLWGYQRLQLDTVRAYDGQKIGTAVEISDYSYATDYGVAADGYIKLDGNQYRIRVYLADETPLSPGDRVDGDIRLRMTVEGGKQQPTYHQGDGIFLLGYADEEAVVTKAGSVPVKYLAAKLRNNILSAIDTTFPADTYAFAKALLLGESHDLSYDVDTAFKVSGIRHVIAVSGLHVSILMSLIYMFAGRNRLIVPILGLPLLFLFAALAGFTPSIVRACVMQGLMLLALLFRKEYDPPTALATAVLVMLLANPITITSVSFQLSAGCVAGILLFSKRIHDYFLQGKLAKAAKGNKLSAKCIRGIVSSVSVTLGAMSLTTPISAFYFGTVSLVGILTNVLTLWVVSFVFYGIMLSCVLGFLWIPAGMAVAWVISWPVRYVMWIAKVLSSIPLAAVYTCSVYIVIWLVMSYLLLAAFLFSKKRHPVILSSCIFVSLLVAVSLSHFMPRLDDYRVTVLDVGEGQCILLQSDDHNYLVDCGGELPKSVAEEAAQLLLSQGITKLDGVFLTHYEEDHACGLPYLLTSISADSLYLPDIPDSGSVRSTLESEYGNRIVWISQKRKLSMEGFSVSVFPAEKETKGNESSLCLLFQRENCDILITGDRSSVGEQALLEETELPKLELLVVGHHGSSDATSMQLLHATEPTTAVICVGRRNFYGHPNEQVLERLRLFGVRVYRTDQQGTIVFRG